MLYVIKKKTNSKKQKNNKNQQQQNSNRIENEEIKIRNSTHNKWPIQTNGARNK